MPLRKLIESDTSSPGQKYSPYSKNYCLSTGTGTLDYYLGGGFVQNSTCVIDDANFSSHISKNFIRHFIGAGRNNGDRIVIVGNPHSTQPLFSQSPELNCLSDEVDQKDSTQRLKIAWRYESLKNVVSGYNEDLSSGEIKTEVAEIHLDSYELGPAKALADLRDILRDSHCSFSRIILMDFGSPGFFRSASANVCAQFLFSLKSLVSTSDSRAVCIATISRKCAVIVSNPLLFADYVLSIVSFDQLPDNFLKTNALFNKDHVGLLTIMKIPYVGCAHPQILEDSKFGIKKRRQQLIFERLHLPPDLSDTANRSNTDVLTSCTASSSETVFWLFTMIYDVIICGCGVMGVSSALYCLKAGMKVLLLEQYEMSHCRGSSHGQSRITRKAYMESAVISEMMTEAHCLWQELEKEMGAILFMNCGTLYVEHEPGSRLQQMAVVNDKLANKYAILDARQLEDKFGLAIKYPNYIGLLDLEGGLLLANVCLNKIHELYVNLGGEYMDKTPVAKVIPGIISKVCIADGRSFEARNIVISMGPWSEAFLKTLGVNISLQLEAVSVCYWRSKCPEAFTIDKLPCLIDITSGFYALPALEYPGCVKLVNSHTNEPCSHPDERDKHEPAQNELVESYASILQNHFPSLETSPAFVERCIYTKTRDSNWIIDKHPDYKNIIILAGFSGHGFKAGPLIGKLVSEMIQSGSILRNRYDMREFSLARFENISCN